MIKKNPLDRDSDGDVDMEDFKAWLKGAQSALDETAKTIEAQIRKGGAKVDAIVSSASKSLQQKLEKLNDFGRKIGGQKGGPPRKEQDGGRK